MKVNKSAFSIERRISPYVLAQLRKEFNAGIAGTAKKALRAARATAPQFGKTNRRISHAHWN